MIKNILSLEMVTVLKKEQQKTINAGFGGCQAEFRSCSTDSDCPCSVCGITISGFYIPDLCAY